MEACDEEIQNVLLDYRRTPSPHNSGDNFQPDDVPGQIDATKSIWRMGFQRHNYRSV